MRTRNNAIVNEPFRLHQFVTDALTQGSQVLDATPTVAIYDVNPRKVQSATPILTPTPTQMQVEPHQSTPFTNLWYLGDGPPEEGLGEYGDLYLDQASGNYYRRTVTPATQINVAGAYYVDPTITTAGWYWDRWTVIVGGKTYHHDSSFYVSADMPVAFQDWPNVAPPFYVQLLTEKLFLGSIQWLRFKVTPANCPAPQVRLLLSGDVVIDWTDDVTFDAKGNLNWLVDLSDPANLEGVYTLEARLNLGQEWLISSPMYVKFERNNDSGT